MFKLVLVTVYFRGRAKTCLVSGKQNGKGSYDVPLAVLKQMANDLGCSDGQTFSFG